jgi:hypothetical protein
VETPDPIHGGECNMRLSKRKRKDWIMRIQSTV